MGFGGIEKKGISTFSESQGLRDRISEIGSSGVLHDEGGTRRGKRVKKNKHSPLDLWARHNGMHAG